MNPPATVLSALTPAGTTSTGNPLYLVPGGSRIRQNGVNCEILASNGTLLHTFENVLSSQTKAGASPERRQNLDITQASVTVNATTANYIDAFNTSFVVPPNPTNFESQLLYFAAGQDYLDPTSGEIAYTIRAALQYGGSFEGGGPFWTWALQFIIAPGPYATYLQAVPAGDTNITYDVLEVGQRLDSFVVYDAPYAQENPGYYWYNCGFAGIAGNGIPDGLILQVGWETPVTVVKVSVEEEGVFQASDYPTGSLIFENINLTMTVKHGK
ncbi:hypothetical protein HMN09_00874800 [Mycena chlorophos]|uniref:Uncharacterized protein n=1 Tax=Mycena chlorophos TaxID=658473 RepID=A0A8H6SR40_MYCCL|nr:hypothetical protein HMN09_00874800 [Mycena chlorophos]